MRVLKVKVISLPYIFQVLYVLCFTRSRYQVSVYRTNGPLVYLFYRHSKAANFEAGNGIRPKFKLMQAFMVVLITCRNEEYQFKNEGDRVATTFLPL